MNHPVHFRNSPPGRDELLLPMPEGRCSSSVLLHSILEDHPSVYDVRNLCNVQYTHHDKRTSTSVSSTSYARSSSVLVGLCAKLRGTWVPEINEFVYLWLITDLFVEVLILSRTDESRLAGGGGGTSVTLLFWFVFPQESGSAAVQDRVLIAQTFIFLTRIFSQGICFSMNICA